MEAQGVEFPSLAGGSLRQWAEESRAKGWMLQPHPGGIEAFLGEKSWKVGISGSYATGFVVIDSGRCPVDGALLSLAEAMPRAEAMMRARKAEAEAEAAKEPAE
jgi:hypothetical protein